ncbi:hypothetical protein C1Y40_05690 [Mycobacterium talmoniae]|uniref:Uncharacterized protein n=1 Tax=Mycobacterium talmoniae TaxID=1858794 RepID=A0A2S8BBX3_9MYCO|nr:hypothetical protein C1Y40_05690 [Mycobacterium talmoniae]
MILGLATATMVESTRIMKNPTTIAHSADQGFAVAGRVAVLMPATAADPNTGGQQTRATT